MAGGIQIENGNFTRIHNDIVERLAQTDLSGSEFRCLWFLLRKTYGFQKKEDDISYSQFAEGTGLDRRNVMRSLDKLVQRGIVYRKENGNNRPQTWGFNKYFEQWNRTSGQNDTSETLQTSGQNDTSLGQTSGQNGATSGQNDTRTSGQITTTSSGQNDTHKRKKEIKENTKESSAVGVVVGGSELPKVTVADVHTLWQNNMPGSMSPIIAEELDDLIETYTPVEVDTAIRLAVSAGKRNIRYIAGILRRRASGEDKPQPAQPPPKVAIGVSGNLGFSLATLS